MCKVKKKYWKYEVKDFQNKKNSRLIMQWKCAACGIKKSRFVKEEEARDLLSNLGIKTPLNKILLLRDILFWVFKNEYYCEQIFTGNNWNNWEIYADRKYRLYLQKWSW